MILGGIAADAAKRGAAPRLSVLVVDDDPTGRLLARAALESQMHVTEAENGLVAVGILEERAFDIAILDLDMPLMDGFGVIERVRSRPETRHMPIIVVTGRDDVVSIERAFALGATSFLCKPINWNVFRHQVGYVLKVSVVERELREENERAEALASFGERSRSVLETEIRGTVANIARLSRAEPSALKAVAISGERLYRALARVARASDILMGNTEFAQESILASDVATAAIASMGEIVGAEAAKMVELIDPDGPRVLCDRVLAREALAEVLANAVRVSPPGRPVKLRIIGSPDSVRFEIEDTGPGIPEYLLETGLDMTVRMPPVKGGLGAGLGLVVTRTIMERHNGHFGIMSEPGRGTEMFLTFRAAAGPCGRRTGEQAVKESDRIATQEFSVP